MGFADLVTAVDRVAQALLGGVAVTYAPEVGDPVEVTGLFDERYVLRSPGRAEAEAIAPSVFLRLEDLPTDPADDDPTLVIGGTSYQVIERQPDGQGGIRLILQLAPAGGS